jgi:hypothetical protein
MRPLSSILRRKRHGSPSLAFTTLNEAGQVKKDNISFLEGHVEPFRQKYDIFNRAFWDPSVKSRKSEEFFSAYRKPLENQWKGKQVGFGQKVTET